MGRQKVMGTGVTSEFQSFSPLTACGNLAGNIANHKLVTAGILQWPQGSEHGKIIQFHRNNESSMLFMHYLS